MAHLGNLGSRQASEDVQDIRGTVLRDSNDQKLGTVDDLILDHDTMEIRYLVLDSEGWLQDGRFLLPVERVSADRNHEDGLTTDATRSEIKASPQYDELSLNSDRAWKKYEKEFKKYWDDKPIMHIKDSDRIITPPEEPAAAQPEARATSAGQEGSREINAAQLFPERISDVFSDPAPSSSKVTLKPKSVARAEQAASGASLLKPRWWEAFENYLRENKSDIQGNCSQCNSRAA
jgi:sporulation protein YlmC with PRC-barrel domain